MLSNRSIFLLAAVAIILGVASPYMVDPTPDTSRLVFAWFYWLPGVVGYWLWPESETAFMALWMWVCTLQYFAVFMFLAAVAPLVRDFLKPHKHRGGLIRPGT
jgi:hypothetical protein